MGRKKSWRERIAGAKPSEKKPWVIPGLFTVDLEACKMVESQNGDECFVVETRMVESNVDERPVGGEMSWVVNLDGKFPESAAGRVKAFILAATGFDDGDLDEEEFMKLVDEIVDEKKNPLAGTRMRLEATHNDSKTFTRTTWSKLRDPQAADDEDDIPF